MINVPEIFKNLESWNKLKKNTLFKNQNELENYQNYYLKKIKNNKKKYNHFELTTSGTTSNISKKYSFPKELFWIIDNHHMWRIFESHKIKSGNCIKIFQAGRSSKKKFTGPEIDSSMGVENNTWTLLFNAFYSDSVFWKQIFNQINMINPNFLYTTPSVFESFYNFLLEENLKFNFPVIFSCETLSDSTRNKANIFFSKSIDKMKDWTTGFGFFECPFGTKHVYDDLCICEQKENNKICSTDLFNYNQKIINLISDDLGIIKKNKCDCGIYGNILEKFEGKFFECLVSITGKKYSANYVSNALNEVPFELIQYEIIQNKERIEFNTVNELGDFQAMQIATLINRIIGETKETFSIFNNKKLLFLSYDSNLCLNFFTKHPKLYNNKKVSVRSYNI